MFSTLFFVFLQCVSFPRLYALPNPQQSVTLAVYGEAGSALIPGQNLVPVGTANGGDQTTFQDVIFDTITVTSTSALLVASASGFDVQGTFTNVAHEVVTLSEGCHATAANQGECDISLGGVTGVDSGSLSEEVVALSVPTSAPQASGARPGSQSGSSSTPSPTSKNHGSKHELNQKILVGLVLGTAVIGRFLAM
ncbi:hypothetical protein BDP27DRAFT_1356435 [Rhodocollybia butyracea]|uniref:Uncharacterized protein n=1 Tax=Rhodocollybia butyracea TaxID=206335 RepID=A0A9P5Q5Q8_9AGAR|nr:hypothetical protein BDP27DRAFT_1356435 [Rhodocollybia butyracea]